MGLRELGGFKLPQLTTQTSSNNNQSLSFHSTLAGHPAIVWIYHYIRNMHRSKPPLWPYTFIEPEHNNCRNTDFICYSLNHQLWCPSISKKCLVFKWVILVKIHCNLAAASWQIITDNFLLKKQKGMTTFCIKENLPQTEWWRRGRKGTNIVINC